MFCCCKMSRSMRTAMKTPIWRFTLTSFSETWRKLWALALQTGKVLSLRHVIADTSLPSRAVISLDVSPLYLSTFQIMWHEGQLHLFSTSPLHISIHALLDSLYLEGRLKSYTWWYKRRMNSSKMTHVGPSIRALKAGTFIQDSGAKNRAFLRDTDDTEVHWTTFYSSCVVSSKNLVKLQFFM